MTAFTLPIMSFPDSVPASTRHSSGAGSHGTVQRFDHNGIAVANLDSVKAFFGGLGLEVEGTGSGKDESVETVCSISGADCEITMLRPPDGGSRLELASFFTPDGIGEYENSVPMAHVRGPEAITVSLFGGIGWRASALPTCVLPSRWP